MNYLTVILVSLLLSAFFSGMEIAYIASNKLRIELDKKQGLLTSRIISFLVQKPGEFITTMLVGNNLALVVYGLYMARILEPGIAYFVSSEIAILLIQTIISTLIILITAEFLPKALVRINPNFILNIFSLPVLFFYTIFYPITFIVVGFVNIILRKRIKALSSDVKKNPVFNKVDLYHLISEISEKNQVENSDADELKLFQNALEFSGIKVRDCMIPRNEIVAMDINTEIETLKQKFIETGYSKILIYETSFDNFVGYITSKSLFNNPKEIKPLLIKISFVPETMAANNLLHRLIKEQRSMALVVDEFGGISGLVTIEDIIEEIIGDIEDEHDSTGLIEKKINDDEYIFSGRLEIDYINEKYHLDIPESEEYDTLAGYIFFHFESFPKLHERIVTGNIECRIIKVSKTKIELVQLKVLKNGRHKTKKTD
ncbi:MAG: HlyC/CorC family transporter [Bacteroidales bacterium]|nr:HlyC/CorC family transporter [Bacteroidales bacterium]